MYLFNTFIKYTLKKRKRCLFTAICSGLLVCVGIQHFFFHEEYSPLQLLPSVENEASRLLSFMSQIQMQCNISVATSNASMWMLCPETEMSFSSEGKSLIVYSVGPNPDFSFEYFVSKNLSSRLYIFSHLADKLKFLLKASPTTTSIFKTTIVPNDPSDFARNSFDTQTLNSVMVNLKHSQIDILKIDAPIDSVHSYEILHFLVADSLLSKVKELHFVLKLDRLEEDYIYSWYRVLYTLFHKAGFRLYHTATSDPLCLQDTIMESCKYFLSWIRQPPPQVFVMYPPAIDGSYEYESERMLTYLDEASSVDGHLLPVMFRFNPVSRFSKSSQSSMKLSLKLSQNVIKKNSQSCCVIFVLDKPYQFYTYQSANKKATGCITHLFAYSSSSSSYGERSSQLLNLLTGMSDSVNKSQPLPFAFIQNILTSYSANILYIELEQAWDLFGLISTMEIPKYVDQLIIKTYIFPVNHHSQAGLLRKRFSELKRLEEFQFKLVGADKEVNGEVPQPADQDVFTLNFVRSILL